jgi:hypothetical protein
MPPGGEERKALKKGNPIRLPISGPLLYGGSSPLLLSLSASPAKNPFTFCSPINFAQLSQLSLLLNSLSSRDEESVLLDWLAFPMTQLKYEKSSCTCKSAFPGPQRLSLKHF